MAHLCWLHLSDWHQGGSDFDRNVVCDALIEDIANREKISPALKNLSFIFFTGDLAFRGFPDEYETSKDQFLDRILKATGLATSQLVIVPGNHDLDRDSINTLPDRLQQPVWSREEVKTWLNDEENRNQILKPFENFTRFVTGYTGQQSPDYASINKWSVAGKMIGCLGVNSAWMCGRNKDTNGEINDYGYTIIGEPQIYGALKEISSSDLRIIVLHHGFDYLAEFERYLIGERLERTADFILHGHQHYPQVRVNRGTSGNCIVIPAGASYNRRVSLDQRFANAYNLVVFDMLAGTGKVFLRRWSDQRQQWIEDIDSFPGGVYEFQSPKSLSTEKSAGFPHPASPFRPMQEFFTAEAIPVTVAASEGITELTGTVKFAQQSRVTSGGLISILYGVPITVPPNRISVIGTGGLAEAKLGNNILDTATLEGR